MSIRRQKVHPVGWRVGYYRKWKSLWFQEKINYGKYLHKMLFVEQMLESFFAFNVKPSIVCGIQILNKSSEDLNIFIYFYQLRDDSEIKNKRLDLLLKKSFNNLLVLGWKKNKSVKNRYFSLNKQTFLEKSSFLENVNSLYFLKKIGQSSNDFTFFYMNSIIKKICYHNFVAKNLKKIIHRTVYLYSIIKNTSKVNLIFIFFLQFFFFDFSMVFDKIKYSFFKHLSNYIVDVKTIFLQSFFKNNSYSFFLENNNLILRQDHHFTTLIKNRIMNLKDSTLWRKKKITTYLKQKTQKRFYGLEKRLFNVHLRKLENKLKNNGVLTNKLKQFFINQIWNYTLFTKKKIKSLIQMRFFVESIIKNCFVQTNIENAQNKKFIKNVVGYASLFLQMIHKKLLVNKNSKRIVNISNETVLKKYSKFYKFLLRRDLKLFDQNLMYNLTDLEKSLSIITNQNVSLYFINSLSFLYNKVRIFKKNYEKKDLRDEWKRKKAAFSFIKKHPQKVNRYGKQKGVLVKDLVLLILICIATRQLKPLVRFIGYQMSLLPKVKRQVPFLRFIMKTVLKLSWIFTPIKGVKIQIKGRFDRWRRRKSLISSSGIFPIQTISKDIEFSSTKGVIKKGTFGIRLWVHYDPTFHSDFKSTMQKYIKSSLIKEQNSKE